VKVDAADRWGRGEWGFQHRGHIDHGGKIQRVYPVASEKPGLVQVGDFFVEVSESSF